MTLSFGNGNAAGTTLTADLVDTLPANVVVAATPNTRVGGGCTLSSVVANPGAGTITYRSGGAIPAGGCTVAVDVTSSTVGGPYTNSINAGALRTGFSNNAVGTSATLTVLQPAFIAGFAYADTNSNGVKDTGENLGIPGVTVTLTGTDDLGASVSRTTPTAADGSYSFANLRPGTYTVTETKPAAFDATGAQVGSAGNGTAGSSATTQFVQNITMTAGSALNNCNFGHSVGEVAGIVYEDKNDDGQYTVGIDTPRSNVTVVITDAKNNTYNLTTGADGSFNQLVPAGATTVNVNETTLGITNPTLTSNAHGHGTNPTTVDVPAGGKAEDNTGYIVASGAIGNYVWLDENSDGRQDPGEPGIANVTVTLTGPVNLTTTTDANGGYLFTGLPAGTYQVLVSASTLPAGLTQTPANPVGAGADFGNQTQPYAITLGAGETNLTADFGYNYNPDTNVNDNTGNAALGDRVWIDADGDGRQDPGEPGVAGVTVNRFSDPDGNGVYDTPAGSTTTDASGNYIFTNLPPGAYVVVVDASTGPLAGYTQTGDPDHFGTTGANDNRTTTPVVLGPGDVFLNVDFGYQPPAAQNNSVGDTVWFDPNANGTQDAGEPGIPGVTVALYRDSNGNGQLDAGEPAIATTTTDASGKYLFAGVPDGNYRLPN